MQPAYMPCMLERATSLSARTATGRSLQGLREVEAGKLTPGDQLSARVAAWL